MMAQKYRLPSVNNIIMICNTNYRQIISTSGDYQFYLNPGIFANAVHSEYLFFITSGKCSGNYYHLNFTNTIKRVILVIFKSL